MRFEQLRQSSGNMKTIDTSESFKSNNAQRQFVYFIVTIWSNTLKDFLSQFL